MARPRTKLWHMQLLCWSCGCTVDESREEGYTRQEDDAQEADEEQGNNSDSDADPSDAESPKSKEGVKDTFFTLEADCFSLSAVWKPENCWWGVNCALAFAMPLGSACVQFFVLYFLALKHGNRFDQGIWLQPWTGIISVDFMKIVSLVMVLCKLSTELGHAKNLCYAMFACEIALRYLNLAGWWAMLLQYTMCISVLFVATSVVLAAQSCTDACLSIFSIFIVVDIDNQVGKFLLNWTKSSTTSLKVKPEFARYEEERGHRIGHECLKFWFLVLPCISAASTVIWSTRYNVIPLTASRHGFVSNEFSPRMLVGRTEGCCPPKRREGEGSDDEATYSVMLLGALRKEHGLLKAVPPVVHWVVVAGTQAAPGPLEVLEGKDVNNNPALLSGSQQANPVQARPFLQEQGYSPNVYETMRDEDQLNLQFVPYSAEINLQGLQLKGTLSYQVHVIAQDPHTLSLSPFPATSNPYRIKGCSRGCSKCENAGTGRCDPGGCALGMYLDQYHGHCRDCPPNCALCGSERSCDSCKEGHIPDEKGNCLACDDPHCRRCKASNSSMCEEGECEDGYDLGANGTCYPCADHRCSRCSDPAVCETCTAGWGLQDGMCAACREGCKDCVLASDMVCQSCSAGFAMDPATKICRLCMEHCVECQEGGLRACDQCRTGFGFSDISKACIPCELEHCEKCSDGRCLQCHQGFGITPRGGCDKCGSFCRSCGASSTCKECQATYTLQDGECRSCGDQCLSCEQAGPSKCDSCLLPFMLDNATKTCVHPSTNPDFVGYLDPEDYDYSEM